MCGLLKLISKIAKASLEFLWVMDQKLALIFMFSNPPVGFPYPPGKAVKPVRLFLFKSLPGQNPSTGLPTPSGSHGGGESLVSQSVFAASGLAI